MIQRIKHIAVAVNDVDAALGAYERRLGVRNARHVDWPQGRSCEAHFALGEVEIQLCQSMDPDGRFARHIARAGEGVQHICLAVDDIEQAIAGATRDGARLKACGACGILGPHPHSEGYVAFLEGQAVPGFELEFMQVYQDGERPAEFARGV
jgi:methylmalonyl-CoA/ethylmalonyl-CoA epimerase